MRDLRQAVNVLRHRPWYAASILTVLAVGFALLASVLAVVDGVLFKPLGYPEEHQLFAVHVASNQSRLAPIVTPDDVTAWGAGVPQMAFTGFRNYGISDGPFICAAVRPDFFDVIGVRPAMGGFAPEHFLGPKPLVEDRVLTHAFFESRFGGDVGAIGRIVITNPVTGEGYRVAGVMPRGFVFPSDRYPVACLAAYMPRRFGSYDNVTGVVARLRPGVAASQMQQRLEAVAMARSVAVGPGPDSSRPRIDRVDVRPLGRVLGAASRPLFSALLAAAGLLLVVAAINASSLMAARSLDRERELAVRRALGATPRDLGRLLLAETALLVGCSAAIGLLLATPFLRLIVPMLPEAVVIFREAAVDVRVLTMVGVAAAALAGLATLGLLRRAVTSSVRLESRRTITSSARSMSQRLVVAVQVALALVLTVGGTLLVGSLLSIYAQEEPISTEGVIVIPSRFLDTTDGSQRTVRLDALLERVRRVPGVEAAAAVGADLLTRGFAPAFGFVQPPTTSKDRVTVQGHPVTAEYYRVVRPELVAGRLPTLAEWSNRDTVVVVGERVASHFWPNASAVGQTLRYVREYERINLTFTVVGVVKDVRWNSWDGAAVPTIYSPFAYSFSAQPTFFVRASSDTSRVTRDVLRTLAEADPMLRTEASIMLEDMFVDTVRPRRLQAWLFGAFAVAGLFVVGIGILGQLAMSTARRTREVGIRIACGATGGRIVRLVLGEQLVPVAIGLMAGVVGSTWAVGFVRGYLFRVTAADPRVWAVAIALILLTAAAGATIPALRAGRVDPTQALRAE